MASKAVLLPAGWQGEMFYANLLTFLTGLREIKLHKINL